jgi:hypothetical protein
MEPRSHEQAHGPAEVGVGKRRAGSQRAAVFVVRTLSIPFVEGLQQPGGALPPFFICPREIGF